MKTLEQIIKDMEAHKEIAERRLKYGMSNRFHKGEIAAISLHLPKLKLLLKDESKQPQPPDFANTMLGEVPHEVTAQSEGTTQAVEGATPVVRQNEQTKELCQCIGVADYSDYKIWNKCSKCGKVYH